MPTVKCPVPGCDYVTDDLDAVIVAALLTTHRTVHIPRTTSVVTEVRRPTLPATGTSEDWSDFKSKWSKYVDAAKITGQEKVQHLLECCDEPLLRNLASCVGGTLTEKSEEELLAALKELVVQEENLVLPRDAQSSSHQDKNEHGTSLEEKQGNLPPTDGVGDPQPLGNTGQNHKELLDKNNGQWKTRKNKKNKKNGGNAGKKGTSAKVLQAVDVQDKVEDTDSESLQVTCEVHQEQLAAKRQEELFIELGLTKYLKGRKIVLQEVMRQSSHKISSVSDIPWHVLSKIMMLDWRGRDDITSTDQTVQERGKDLVTDDMEEILSLITDNTSPNVLSSMPHPMDVLIAVILCSSNFLRQIICEKLFMCKLSIPLVIPSVLKEDPLFLLWALRSTVAEFKLPGGGFCETSVVKHHVPIVSCLRVGEIPRSKSKFLNELLNDQSHPTFFHRDCQNGMNTRILSEGALEISWYFPPQQLTNADLTGNVVFMNLRGDGNSAKTVKSMEFLCRISSVVLVMTDIEGIGNSYKMDSLVSKLSQETKLILMLMKQPKTKFDGEGKERITKLSEQLKFKGMQHFITLDFDTRGELNIKDLKRKTNALINRCLAETTIKRTIEECKEEADGLKIIVDESSSECSKSQKISAQVIEEICRNGMDNLKANNLPLQCQPWQEWAELNKERHRQKRRGNDSMDSYTDKISNEMRKLRQRQLQLIEKPNILCDAFLDNLTDSVSEEILYFLRWLKLHLDEISRQTLPSLQKECSQKWSKIRESDDATKRVTLQDELDKCEIKLAEASFGLEHFTREIAQAYESVQYTGNEASAKTRERMQCLPSIMSELMLLGYPLEIMDGDAAHIPMKWVQAVLSQLTKRIGDKKIFVLSVLGIQSSGKSTLLNTMFGLQFAVAAGRCTRGVFAQLLPVCTEYSGTKYDYILVVDTEGLRAAELGKAKLQHDNEIATLVIGLADVTIVNVKGENVSEMEDVLQIVVHALLKMSLVNKNLKLQPSCIFVHQNVSAQDAAQKLRTGQQRFIETLDKATKAAGKQEDKPNYTRFRQLINFDINKDIWYVSDLWKGDPPMAPVNPGYSENVNTVKQKLMTDVMQNRSFHLTADKFGARLKDLWNGILVQNFVFSFRNSLEMDAYNSLEREFSDILWSMKSSAMEWFNSKRNFISNRENELEKLSLDLTSECRQHLDKAYQEAVKRLENYFTTHEDRSFLEQWRINSTLKLKSSYGNIIDNVTDNVRCEIEKRKIQVEQKKDMITYITRIMTEAQKLAEQLRLQAGKTNLSEEELERRFKKKWNKWMKMIPQKEKEDLDVVQKTNDILQRHFFHDLPLLEEVQERRCKETIRDNCVKSIENYVTDRKLFTLSSIHLCLTKTEDIVLKFINDLLENVKEIVKEKDNKINKGQCAQKVMGRVSETVKKLKSVLNFTNVKELEICLAIFSCQYASHPYSKISKLEPGRGKAYEVVVHGIHPDFYKALRRKFSHHFKEVMSKIEPELVQQRTSRNFSFDIKAHTHMKMVKSNCDKQYIQQLINNLFAEVQSITDKVQRFSEESIEEIIRMVAKMERKGSNAYFTKCFSIDLVDYLCQSCLPKFCEKQKRYEEDMDQRLVYDRDNYGPCFERFKNVFRQFTAEQALANVLSERVAKAIENAVNMDMARTLADDVRNNEAST
ncbi:interferon-induced very large GTPase 1-like isoform X2 [Macrobrachium nipponense]|uniref:interferon-induced very large GTPase 1-like isoform X2 n=1 Tax=Macrobrachium nipponense TaxID=159736 RepID=UPI0030C86689